MSRVPNQYVDTEKSHQCRKHFFRYSTFYSQKTSVRHGGVKLVSCLGRHTSVSHCIDLLIPPEKWTRTPPLRGSRSRGQTRSALRPRKVEAEARRTRPCSVRWWRCDWFRKSLRIFSPISRPVDMWVMTRQYDVISSVGQGGKSKQVTDEILNLQKFSK